MSPKLFHLFDESKNVMLATSNINKEDKIKTNIDKHKNDKFSLLSFEFNSLI